MKKVIQYVFIILFAAAIGYTGQNLVSGPATTTDGNVPAFSGITGDLLGTGYGINTEVGDPGSDSNLVTEQGVREALASVSLGAYLYLTPSTSEPGSPVTNAIYMADGATWDPASYSSSNDYLVLYDGANWIPLRDMVTGALIISPSANEVDETVDRSCTSADFFKTIRVTSASSETMTLPSVDSDDDGAEITFIKCGVGDLVVEASDSDTVGDNSDTQTTGSTTYCTIKLKYIDDITAWVIIHSFGTWTGA